MANTGMPSRTTPPSPRTPNPQRTARDRIAEAVATLSPESKWEIWAAVQKLVVAGTLIAEDVAPVARALRLRYRAERQGARGDWDASLVTIAAAVWLEVPFATWLSWMATLHRHRVPGAVTSGWRMVWAQMGREDWSPARVTQVIDVLRARPPQVSTAFAVATTALWADGRGALADALGTKPSEEALERIRTATAFEAHGTSMDAVIAKATPLRSSVEVPRLLAVDWTARSGAARCGLLRRCVWDDCPPRLRPRWQQLVKNVMPKDQWGVLAGRILMRAQRTPGARGTVLQLLFDADLAGALMADPVTQAFCAEEMATSRAAATHPALVRLVLAGWPVLPARVWVPAVTHMIRVAPAGAEIRATLEVWWAAGEGKERAADPALVAACLGSTDRDLAQWALLTLVPSMATPAPASVPQPRRTR